MRFFKVTDPYFFTEEGKGELVAKYGIQNLKLCFDRQTIIDDFESGAAEKNDYLCIALPEHLDPSFKEFELIRVSNKYGILTKEQYERGLDPQDILASKFNVKIVKPDITFDNYVIDKNGVDFKNLMAQIQQLKIRQNSGVLSKGFMMCGIPGSGKTFFAKATAGTLNRILMMVNVSVFMNSNDPFGQLKMFFDFFNDNPKGEYVVLFDEIEKMLNGDSMLAQQIMGYLLTEINEFNTKGGAKVLLIATANNIAGLSKKNPEFFRKGRWDICIFVDAPTPEKATDTFIYYEKVNNNKFKKETLPYFFKIAGLNHGEEISLDEIPKDSAAFHIIKEIKNRIGDKESSELVQGIKEGGEYYSFFCDLAEKYAFRINTKELVAKSMSMYRNSIPNTNLFPYVSAEIEGLTTELYSIYYFLNCDQIDVMQLLKSNVPLQSAMKDGITEMISATRNFAKFN